MYGGVSSAEAPTLDVLFPLIPPFKDIYTYGLMYLEVEQLFDV